MIEAHPVEAGAVKTLESSPQEYNQGAMLDLIVVMGRLIGMEYNKIVNRLLNCQGIQAWRQLRAGAAES